MTEIVKHTGSALADQIEWTRLVTDGDRAGSILPEAYRGKPANVLIAVGLGSSMGLSPAESLYRIAVIKGKPTAAAELIAANVRKAGHKLRVTSDEANSSVTATIIRSDDPDFPFTKTRDLAWAQRMGLAQNDNYKMQLLTMLEWRAISAVARLACPEALYGVSYTPDEASEVTATETTARRVVTSETFADKPDDDTEDAEVVEETDLTARTRGHMFALFTELGIEDRDAQLAGMVDVIKRPLTSRGEINEGEGQAIVDALRLLKTQREADAIQRGEA